MGANLIAVPCPWGHQKGHLGLLQPAALYLQRNGAAFTLPAAAPPSYPVIPQGSTTAERKQLRAANEGDQQAWQTYLIVETKGVNQLEEAFDNVYHAELDDPDEGLAGVTIMQFLDHIRLRYCQISQPELDANTAKFEEGINSDLPLVVYTWKQERCQLFAESANVPISEATMVTTGTKHALRVGGMRQSWVEWRRTPAGNQNWNQWKVHWTEAFGDLREAKCMVSLSTKRPKITSKAILML